MRVLFLSLLLVLGGCVGNVEVSYLEKVLQKCDKNGGAVRVSMNVTKSHGTEVIAVHCSDGAQYTRPGKE